MNQLSSLTQQRPPIPEGDQTTQAPPASSPVANLSQTSSETNLTEGEASKGNEKETKDKIDSLEKQIRQIKGAEAMSSVNFTDLCIYPNLKLPQKFKMPDFQKYDGKNCPMAHLRLYGVAMTQYSEDEKVLVQIFPNSLTGSALTWYT